MRHKDHQDVKNDQIYWRGKMWSAGEVVCISRELITSGENLILSDKLVNKRDADMNKHNDQEAE